MGFIKCDFLSVDLLYSFFIMLYMEAFQMDIIRVFADNVKKYRKERGYSQEYFSELCGMHRTYISAIECYRRSISLENIQHIADALEIETYKLFIEEDSSKLN